MHFNDQLSAPQSGHSMHRHIRKNILYVMNNTRLMSVTKKLPVFSASTTEVILVKPEEDTLYQPGGFCVNVISTRELFTCV